MQPTLPATRRTPNTSRRAALGARDVCLVGEKPDVLRPVNCTDARVYGLNTKARHEMSIHPPPYTVAVISHGGTNHETERSITATSRHDIEVALFG